MKRKTIFLAVLTFTVGLLISSNLVYGLATQDDAQGDINGIKGDAESSDPSGFELLTPSGMSWMDIDKLTWENDSGSLTISLTMYATIDTQKIIDSQMTVWVGFILEGDATSTAAAALILMLTPSNGYVNGTAVAYTDVSPYSKTDNDCAVVSGSVATWTLPDNFCENVSGAATTTFENWESFGYTYYQYSEGTVDYLYWDDVNYTSQWSTILQLMQNLNDIPGYSSWLIALISVASLMIIYRKKIRK